MSSPDHKTAETPLDSRHTLTVERRLEAYEYMVLTRAFDETMVAMWKQGRGVGGTFSRRGHEAISVPSAWHWVRMTSSHRCTGTWALTW